jgi:hypothetical protein
MEINQNAQFVTIYIHRYFFLAFRIWQDEHVFFILPNTGPSWRSLRHRITVHTEYIVHAAGFLATSFYYLAIFRNNFVYCNVEDAIAYSYHYMTFG